MDKQVPSIPDSELDVLKALWSKGQATVRETLVVLRASGRDWSYATVATLLDRLEGKGLVESDRSDLAFIYTPKITATEVRKRRVNTLVKSLYQGEPAQLVLHLLKHHHLDAETLEQVRSVLEDATTPAAGSTERASESPPSARKKSRGSS